jgi:N-ethylmaleimide reductase
MAASSLARLLPNAKKLTAVFAQKLFTPIQIGRLRLEHRVVMAPLTRSRSQQPGDIPGALMQQYYTQRASKGGLIVSEATSISPSARGCFGSPGIYTDEHLAGWRKITAAIHAKGGFIFSQLWQRDEHRTSIPAALSR